MTSPKVIVVEDEIVLAMELEEKLTEMGYTVVARVTSGEDALSKAEELAPDLVLMDIRLDGEMDGIEAAAQIRQLHYVPIVYLTAYADDKTLKRAKLTEPYGYLVKPYSERELRITIDMALHKAQMEKRLRVSEERFRAVFESAEDLIFVKDRSLKYTHANRAMLKLLSLSESQVLGKTDVEVFGPEEARHSHEVELRVLMGHTVELEHTITLRGYPTVCNFVRVPLRDTSGQISGIAGIGRDVTDRKHKEDEALIDLEPASPDRYPSPVMQNTVRQVRLAAKVDSICLFLGESGVGKDYLARYLHDHSPRSGGPYFCINCAALSPELAESELFGHEKGAFTGATGRKRGLLELAEGGTLLLNEIGELSTTLQTKLLTFLDTKSFTRVGAERNIMVNARLVAATNRELQREVEAGTFRKDLFYRLSVITIHVPPLRERIEDIPILVKDLVAALAKRNGSRHVPDVDSEAMRVLAAYDWPGNIRELRNVLERALIHCGGKRITSAHISLDFNSHSHPDQTGISVKIRVSESSPLPDAINDAKRSLINEAFRLSDGSVKEASRVLGVSRDAFNYLLKSLGMRRK
jgi:PAS domain S-box-containing protein